MAATPGPSRGRVLLVEDNVINQRVVAAMLRGGGYLVDLAIDGEEALHAVQAGGYDVVLMDCQLPRMDGYQAAAAVRTWEGEGRHVPIVALDLPARWMRTGSGPWPLGWMTFSPSRSRRRTRSAADRPEDEPGAE